VLGQRIFEAAQLLRGTAISDRTADDDEGGGGHCVLSPRRPSWPHALQKVCCWWNGLHEKVGRAHRTQRIRSDSALVLGEPANGRKWTQILGGMLSSASLSFSPDRSLFFLGFVLFLCAYSPHGPWGHGPSRNALDISLDCFCTINE